MAADAYGPSSTGDSGRRSSPAGHSVSSNGSSFSNTESRISLNGFGFRIPKTPIRYATNLYIN